MTHFRNLNEQAEELCEDIVQGPIAAWMQGGQNFRSAKDGGAPAQPGQGHTFRSAKDGRAPAQPGQGGTQPSGKVPELRGCPGRTCRAGISPLLLLQPAACKCSLKLSL